MIRVAIAGMLVLGASVNAQTLQDEPVEPIEEIVVVVDRKGNTVDAEALRLEKIKMQVIREFAIEQADQEEEFWRLKLRAAMKKPTSRIAWGYDARWESTLVWHTPATLLPIDRPRPATVISIRF